MNTLTELDVSLLDLSKEELQHECSTLKIKLKTVLDESNQKMYDLQREVTRLQSLEQEYLSEIEILQSNDRAEVKKLEGKISDLHEEISETKVQSREAVLELEQLILKKDEEIEGLKAPANVSCLSGINEGEYNKLLEENSVLKEQLEELLNRLLEKEVGSNDLVKQLERVSQERDEKVEEYNSIQENYKIKKQELIETNELIETLQEKIMVMSCELDAMKNKPSNTDSRGNSLFAEVNDRRVQLEKNMEVMKVKYVKMKNEHSFLLNQIAALKRENTYLTERWNEDVTRRESDKGKELMALQNRVETLELSNKRCEELLQERLQLKSNMPEDEMKCIEMMLKNKDKLLEESWKIQNDQSLKVVSLSRDLHNCGQELREWKSKSFKLECKLSELKTELQIVKQDNPLVLCNCKEEKEKQRKKENYNFIQNLYKLHPPPTKAPTKKPVVIDIKSVLTNKQSIPGHLNADFNNGNEERVLFKSNEEIKNPLIDKPASILSNKGGVESATDASAERVKDKAVTRRKKVVQFTRDTRDINETNSEKPKKGGVILSCPVVYVPSPNVEN